MMLTLIATCYLAAQTLFAVPSGWTVEDVYTGGPRPFSLTLTLEYCNLGCEEARKRSYIRLSRKAAAGEIVEAPKDCALQATVEAAP